MAVLERHAPERAGGESSLTAHALHVQRRRHGGDGAAHHPAGHRQRGERLDRGEREAGEPVDGDQRRVVAQQQRLAGGEQSDVAAGTVHVSSLYT